MRKKCPIKKFWKVIKSRPSNKSWVKEQIHLVEKRGDFKNAHRHSRSFKYIFWKYSKKSD